MQCQRESISIWWYTVFGNDTLSNCVRITELKRMQTLERKYWLHQWNHFQDHQPQRWQPACMTPKYLPFLLKNQGLLLNQCESTAILAIPLVESKLKIIQEGTTTNKPLPLEGILPLSDLWRTSRLAGRCSDHVT